MMKKIIVSFFMAAAVAVQAQDKSISGIVTTRLVQPDGQTVAFVLVKPGEPTIPVQASGADAMALLPRNQITLSGTPVEGAFGPGLQVKAGSVSVTDSNQLFTSQTVGATMFKDATAMADHYVQLTNVTFVADKFDATGIAQVKADDGSTITLLVGKSAAGRDTPKSATDVIGVAVKNGGEWRLVATRFLPANRRESVELATKSTCMSCHNTDAKLVGPAYRDVAARYRNDPDAASKLVAQMQNGGTGKWGAAVMPPLKALVQPDDMQKLADWILGYRWDAILAE